MIPRIVAKSVYSFFLLLIFIKTVAKSFAERGGVASAVVVAVVTVVFIKN